MTHQNNTVLITGGSSGIGFELSKQLLKQKNRVLTCGRSADKLKKAKRLLPEIHYLQCDISKTDECHKLARWVSNEHPDCNTLINNAAIVHTDHFLDDDHIFEKADAEVQTNLMGPIRLSKFFIPIIQKNKGAKIINITTGLVYVPRATYPFYNATKAALHSFTQVLRSQLDSSPIEVIEVLFPAVDTPWHKGNPPKIAISTEKAVYDMLTGIEKGKEEIRVGKAKLLYLLARIAPNFAFKKFNTLAD